MRDLAVFCADVGSVKSGNFGWARSEAEAAPVPEHDTSRPADLAEAVVRELRHGHPVALGFECPLFVPVPALDTALGAARPGEGNRAWSAGAGSGALTTGLVQVAWVLAAIRARCPEERLHLEWQSFEAHGQGVLVWEAFVSARAKDRRTLTTPRSPSRRSPGRFPIRGLRRQSRRSDRCRLLAQLPCGAAGSTTWTPCTAHRSSSGHDDRAGDATAHRAKEQRGSPAYLATAHRAKGQPRSKTHGGDRHAVTRQR